MICGTDVSAEVVVLTQERTQALTAVYPDCEVHIALAIKKLRALGARNIVITLGDEGIAVCVGQEITLLPTPIETADEIFLQRLEERLTVGETLVNAAQFAAR